jgi:Sec-independent protein translocase protein TatA
LEEISQDEADLVQLQVDQHLRSKRNVCVQTDAVVILGPDDVLPPQASEAFSSIMKTLKQLQKSQSDEQKSQQEVLRSQQELLKSQQELHKSQQETLNSVGEMSQEIKNLRQSRNSIGSLLNTTGGEFQEFVMNTAVETPVETARGLEESLISKNQLPMYTEQTEMITVHLGMPQDNPENIENTPSALEALASAEIDNTLQTERANNIGTVVNDAITTETVKNIVVTEMATSDEETVNDDTTFTTINLSQASSIMTAAIQEKNPSPTLNKKTFKLKCFAGPIVEIETPDDMIGVSENAEVRVKQTKTFEIFNKACSKSNFGWMVTQTLYKDEEMIGRNFFGNRRNTPALSPRRRHAVEHAIAEVYGLCEANLKEVIKGVNTGLRHLRRRLPFSRIDGNSNSS